MKTDENIIRNFGCRLKIQNRIGRFGLFYTKSFAPRDVLETGGGESRIGKGYQFTDTTEPTQSNAIILFFKVKLYFLVLQTFLTLFL